jgi:hypothetical protein
MIHIQTREQAYNYALRAGISLPEVESAFCACDEWDDALRMLGIYLEDDE